MTYFVVEFIILLVELLLRVLGVITGYFVTCFLLMQSSTLVLKGLGNLIEKNYELIKSCIKQNPLFEESAATESLNACIAIVGYAIEERFPILDTLTPFMFDVLSTAVFEVENDKAVVYYLIETADFCDQGSPCVVTVEILPTQKLWMVEQAVWDSTINTPIIYLTSQDLIKFWKEYICYYF